MSTSTACVFCAWRSKASRRAALIGRNGLRGSPPNETCDRLTRCIRSKPEASMQSTCAPHAPVMLPGCATTLVAAAAMKTPAPAQYEPIETTTGRPDCRSHLISLQISSEASASPPLVSIRRTTAQMRSSLRAARSCAQIVSGQMHEPPVLSGWREMVPHALTTATARRGGVAHQLVERKEAEGVASTSAGDSSSRGAPLVAMWTSRIGSKNAASAY
mmetsp:Transcript_44852/g.111689  ORF Transcript_44852/g.111689 Transcript_44852/m.111689 type:complete len:217 (+) Transcript_44852:773-1423(+)